MSGLHVAIAGATGAVGAEFLRLFEKRSYPVRKLSLLASKRSVGKTLRFRGEDLEVEELTPTAFAGVDQRTSAPAPARARLSRRRRWPRARS